MVSVRELVLLGLVCFLFGVGVGGIVAVEFLRVSVCLSSYR